MVAPIPDRAAKRIVAREGAAGPPPRFWSAPDPDGQARAVTAEIVRMAEAGVPLEEQAVLMRAVRLEARPVTDALERAGVPHQVRGGFGLFERREVRSAVAWLRAAADPSDAQAHLRLAVRPAPRRPLDRGRRRGLVRRRGRPARSPGRWPPRAPALAPLLEEAGRAAAGLPPADALRAIVDGCGLRAAALAAGGAEGAGRLAGLAALEHLAGEIAAAEPALDARGLAARLAGLAEIGFRGDGAAPRERSGVQVMTIHQAKGLEFDAVFVIGLTRANFPGSDRGGADIPDALLPEVLPRGRDAHVAEARRLAYVAMTRARRHLVLATVAAGAGRRGAGALAVLRGGARGRRRRGRGRGRGARARAAGRGRRPARRLRGGLGAGRRRARRRRGRRRRADGRRRGRRPRPRRGAGPGAAPGAGRPSRRRGRPARPARASS